MPLIVVLIVFGLIAIWAVSLHNRLVTALSVFRNAFAQIDVQLRGRAYPDLEGQREHDAAFRGADVDGEPVAFARQAFSDAVMGYNNACEMLPNSLIAGTFNFEPARMLDSSPAGKREPPKVSFG
jgi:hypothetical protein